MGTKHIPVRFAGFWRRLGAYLIDTFIVWFFLLLIGLVLRAGMMIALDRPSDTRPFALLFVLLAFLYWTVLESLSAATVGKQLLRLQVTRADGRRMGLGRSALRQVLKLPSLSMPLLGLLIGVTDEKTGLHDLLVRTRVRVI